MSEVALSSAELEALREENRKLRKINAALIDRVERSSDMAGNAFSMFETAISLEAMVRERTAQLEEALAKLAEVNADLAAARPLSAPNGRRSGYRCTQKANLSLGSGGRG